MTTSNLQHIHASLASTFEHTFLVIEYSQHPSEIDTTFTPELLRKAAVLGLLSLQDGWGAGSFFAQVRGQAIASTLS